MTQINYLLSIQHEIIFILLFNFSFHSDTYDSVYHVHNRYLSKEIINLFICYPFLLNDDGKHIIKFSLITLLKIIAINFWRECKSLSIESEKARESFTLLKISASTLTLTYFKSSLKFNESSQKKNNFMNINIHKEKKL